MRKKSAFRSPHAVSRSHLSPVTLVILFALWVILSGKFTVFHLSVGLTTVALVAWLQSFLVGMRKEGEPRLRLIPLLIYVPWLLGQMIISTLLVARLILWDRKSINPRMIAFRSKQPSVVQHAVFANSITLTPGTLTVDLKDDRYMVHAICAQTENDLLAGTMAHKVACLSGSDVDSRPERILLDNFENG